MACLLRYGRGWVYQQRPDCQTVTRFYASAVCPRCHGAKKDPG